MESRLCRLRLEAGLTRRQLARRSGLSLATIGAYETGTRTMLLTNAIELALALGVTLDELTEFDRILAGTHEGRRRGRPRRPRR